MIKGGKMKKKFITLFIIILIGLSILLYLTNSKDNNKDNNLTKVKVADLSPIFIRNDYFCNKVLIIQTDKSEFRNGYSDRKTDIKSLA